MNYGCNPTGMPICVEHKNDSPQHFVFFGLFVFMIACSFLFSYEINPYENGLMEIRGEVELIMGVIALIIGIFLMVAAYRSKKYWPDEELRNSEKCVISQFLESATTSSLKLPVHLIFKLCEAKTNEELSKICDELDAFLNLNEVERLERRLENAVKLSTQLAMEQ